MDNSSLQKLIQRYNSGQCTEEEKVWLEDWYNTFEWEKSLTDIPNEEIERLKTETWQAIQSSKNKPLHGHKRVLFTKRVWYTAAAIAGLALGIFSLSKFLNGRLLNNKDSGTSANSAQYDIRPGSSKATLVLANGRTVFLDSAFASSMQEEDGTTIDKQGGKLVYGNNDNNSANAPLFNTLNVPRGGEYQLILPDGTKVWMNAASSLKYPTRFNGTERKVFLTGEAYFEVAKNASKPFRVMLAKDATIEVLGTHFNIKAYDDENAFKTTLAEGSVKVYSNKAVATLSPSQQAVWGKSSNQITVREVNVEKELAWKNGMMEFNDDDLPYIMREVSRWYNVTVKYEGRISGEGYRGTIPRYALLSEVMRILKSAGVEYKIENNTVVIIGK